MRPILCLSVRPTPVPACLADIRDRLARAFPGPSNAAYVDALIGGQDLESLSPHRSEAAAERWGALSLLADLTAYAGSLPMGESSLADFSPAMGDTSHAGISPAICDSSRADFSPMMCDSSLAGQVPLPLAGSLANGSAANASPVIGGFLFGGDLTSGSHENGEIPSLILMRDAHGRPYAIDRTGRRPFRPFDFNLSHTKAHIACALLLGGDGMAETESAPNRIPMVGLDVEEPIPAPRAAALAARYATEGERARMSPAGARISVDGSPPPHMRTDGGRSPLDFTRIWTMREAIGKYLGEGKPLCRDAVAPPPGTRLWCARLPDTGAALTLCVPDFLRADDLYISPDSLPLVWTSEGS